MATEVVFPDGARVLARGLRRDPAPDPPPTFGLYLGVPPETRWAHDRVDWPDFRLPRDPAAAVAALADVRRRALAGERVEIACRGGRGRTGTALAVLAVMTGVAPDAAVAWVRAAYHPRAVETPWQARWVRRVPDLL